MRVICSRFLEVTPAMQLKEILKRTARTGLFLMTAAALLVSAPAARASAGNNNLKIIAWYGAGNLSASMYGRDTVILFNPTQAPITMNNWSLQTGGSTGKFSTIYDLPNVTIPAGGFYAIAGSGPNYISSAGCTSNICNTNYPYDYQLKTIEGTATASDNDLSSTAVVVALVSKQTSVGSTCPSASTSGLVDLVGIGASDGSSPVTCYAGSGYAYYTPSTLNGATTGVDGAVYAYATIRKNKCIDTFNNANDFMLGFIPFANSQSTPEPCPTGNQLSVSSVNFSPNNPHVLDPFTVTAKVTPATSPNSTNLQVTADLTSLGLSSNTKLYDDGTHGDAVAGDGTYSLATAAQSATNYNSGTFGPVPGLFVTATDGEGNSASDVGSLNIAVGSLSMTTPTTTVTVHAGDVATFPIKIQSLLGYAGTLNITCSGSPNTNNLGLPVGTQCVSTPPEVTLGPDGSTTISVAIATGETVPASILSRSLPLALLGLLSIGLLTVGIWRRKHLASALLVAVAMVVVFNITGCAKDAGLTGDTASPNTYTYTLSATDAVNPTVINNQMTFTVTVQ